MASDNVTSQIFIPIRLGTLRSDQKVTFDIFIKVAGRQVHYIKNTDVFEGDRIQRLKIKGVKKLFISEKDEQVYLDYLDTGLDLLKDEKISVQDRGAMASGSIMTAAENAERAVETEQGYRRTEGQLGKVVEFMATDERALQNIMNSAGLATDSFHHSANVASLSLGLAVECGVDDMQKLNELGFGGLLHDIGKVQLGFKEDVLRENLQGDELKKYKTHCEVGVQHVSGKPFITAHVIELIQNHEEQGDGVGYPNKRNIKRLPLTSQIMSLCNEFDHYCMVKKQTPLEAFPSFKQEKGDLFIKEQVGILGELLKKK